MAADDRGRYDVRRPGRSGCAGHSAHRPSLAVLVARDLARDSVRPRLKRLRIFGAIDEAVAEEGWKIVVLVRLSLVVPFNLQNYCLASLRFHSGSS